MVKYPASFQGIVQALADLIGTISGSSGTGGASAANQVIQTEKLDSLIGNTDSIETYLAGLPTNQSDPTDWLSVRLTNGTSFYSATGGGGGGGGTEYTEGDSVSAIVGSAILWEDTGDVLRSVSATKPLPVGGNVNASLTGGVIGISGTVNTNASLIGGSVSVTGTVNASLVGGQSTIVGNVDVTPTTPVAGDYLPVRLTDGSNFYLASGGGGGGSGQQYTEGNTSTSITGTALMWEDSDTLRAAGNIYPFPISDNGGSLTVDGTINVGNSLTVASITNAVSLSGGSVTISNTPNVVVNSGTLTTVQTIDTLKGGVITRIDTLAGGRVTQVDTLLGGIITRIDSLAGFVDITPTSPIATDYLPVRLTDGTAFFTTQSIRAVTNSNTTVTIALGSTTSSAFSITGHNSLIHIPPASPARTVKLQILGGDAATWVDALSKTTSTSTWTFFTSGDIATAVSGATGASKNNFRITIDSSYGSTLSFLVESRG